MARWRDDDWPVPLEEAVGKLTVENLKPLVQLVTATLPTRKGDLVKILLDSLRHPAKVRALYKALDPLGQRAVQEAAHQPEGRLDYVRFVAKYGQRPNFYEAAREDPKDRYGWSRYDRRHKPTTLKLFFPNENWLPTDLREVLRTFVPEPPPFVLATAPEPPQTVTQSWTDYEGKRAVKVTEEIPVRVRETAREAEQDLKAVLRLAEAGRLRVTDKKLQPTAATVKTVAEVLLGGDFYTAEDRDEWEDEPAADLAIKAFAWPMILQAADLATKGRGGALALTEAGRKALTRPSHETLRTAWKKWRGSTLLDEFSRVEPIKGQKKARLSALGQRRKTLADALAHCPTDGWIKVDEFYRFLRATGRDFSLAHDHFALYVGQPHYGYFGDGDNWDMLEGRYVLALLFEYAATLGLLDVAYIKPQGRDADYGGHWGTDDLSYLSRYDGLEAFRVNPLGAYCLGVAASYEPPALEVTRVLRVLPNLDVVASQPPLPAADRLVLARFAEPQSEHVWRLTAAKLLPILEEGGSLDTLLEFLAARSGEPLPQTVQVFFDDLRHRTGQLSDLGAARLLECRDATLAKLLAADPLLRDRCQLAGERRLVFRAADESTIRKALRRLGYILPPPKGD